jgi:hypothetical protein
MPLVKDWGFCGGVYTPASPVFDSELTVNLYPEFATKDGNPKTKAELVGRPGLVTWATVNAPIRGVWAGFYKGSFVVFAVGGSHIYQLATNGAVVFDYGAIPSQTNPTPCQLVCNGTQMLVMDSGALNSAGTRLGRIFIVDEAGPSLTPVFDGYALTYLDGFFVAISSTFGIYNQVNVSNLLDGTTWNALNFVQRTGASDYMNQLEVLNGMLWMYGQKAIEIWYDAGNPTFPFSRIQGATLNIGLLEQFSVVKFQNTIMWIGADPLGYASVFRANGLVPTRVSSPGVEYILAKYGQSPFNFLVCYGYEEAGHVFYCINLPNAPNYKGGTGVTLCFDLNTGVWHERTHLSGGVASQHLPQYITSQYGQAFGVVPPYVFAGDYSSGKIFLQSTNYPADAGGDIEYVRQTPHVSDANRWLKYPFLELDADIGTAQAVLSYSNDGGRTFPHVRPAISASTTQAYGSLGGGFGRFFWRQMGRSRDRVFRVQVTDHTNLVRFIGANLLVSDGTEPAVAA